MGAEARYRDLGLAATPPPTPLANYLPAVKSGNLVFLSGHGPPPGPDGRRPAGKAGVDLSVEDAYQAARLVAAALLASLRTEIGSLDRVKRVVKVVGFVNAAPDFSQHAQVVNGASDLLVEVFGDRGRHARAAVGAGSLPLDMPVEIEMVVEVET